MVDFIPNEQAISRLLSKTPQPCKPEESGKQYVVYDIIKKVIILRPTMGWIYDRLKCSRMDIHSYTMRKYPLLLDGQYIIREIKSEDDEILGIDEVCKDLSNKPVFVHNLTTMEVTRYYGLQHAINVLMISHSLALESITRISPVIQALSGQLIFSYVCTTMYKHNEDKFPAISTAKGVDDTQVINHESYLVRAAKSVMVLDIIEGTSYHFPSVNKAAMVVETTEGKISTFLISHTPRAIHNRYIFKESKEVQDVQAIFDSYMGTVAKEVVITNTDTGEVKTYASIPIAVMLTGMSYVTIYSRLVFNYSRPVRVGNDTYTICGKK